jgi:hypothetical protein
MIALVALGTAALWGCLAVQDIRSGDGSEARVNATVALICLILAAVAP